MPDSAWARLLGVAVIVVVFATFVVLPLSQVARSEQASIGAPVDASLRVPAASVLLNWEASTLAPRERLVGIVLQAGSSDRHFVNLESRADLARATEGVRDGTPVHLHIGRGETSEVRRGEIRQVKPLILLLAQWPLITVGTMCLVIAFVALLGGSHPSTSPLIMLSLFLGTALLSLLDICLIGGDVDRALESEIRARIGLASWVLLPAAIAHLAMRFPIVFDRFGSPGLVLLTYGISGSIALFSQVRFHDAVLAGDIEMLSLGASYLAAGILIIASWSALGRLRPIERHRAHILAFGLFMTCIGPLLVVDVGLVYRPEAPSLAVLAIGGLPLGLGWTVARYQLLDPPRWLRGVLVEAISGLLAFTLTGIATSMAVGDPTVLDAWTISRAAAVITAWVAIFHVLRWILWRAVIAGSSEPASMSSLINAATEVLADAHSPEQVAQRLAALVRSGLYAEATVVADVSIPARSTEGALVASGRALWKQAGQPSAGLVTLREPEGDPGPMTAEFVVPLLASAGSGWLMIATRRMDGLPYSNEARTILSSLARMAEVAARASLGAAELERRVEERTRSLSESMIEKRRLLNAARVIFEATSPDAVLQGLEGYLRPSYSELTWTEAESGKAAPGRTIDFDFADGIYRRLELASPKALGIEESSDGVDTAVAFAHLALSRLQMTRILKSQVPDRLGGTGGGQLAGEPGDSVREIAHELRKPIQEIIELSSASLEGQPDPDGGMLEIASTATELDRRLSLLLYRDGLHYRMRAIELCEVVEDGLRRIRTITPDRRFSTSHHLMPLRMQGDRMRLVMVIENIVDNAVKATASGGQIAITSGLRDGTETTGDVEWVWIEVRDDGYGLDPDQVRAVFERGVSLRAGGFGLGLALCRDVIERHGGRIDMSRDGEWTIVRVEIPRWQT